MSPLRQGAHGGAVYETARLAGLAPEAVLDFSNNADSLATPLAASLLTGIEYPFAHYPEEGSPELRRAIATQEGVPPQEVLVGNGSSELIHLALQRLKPKRVLLLGPIFREYARACAALSIPHALYALSREEDFSLDQRQLEVVLETLAAGRFEMLVLCSPNNPTGQCFRLLHELVAQVPCPYVLLDAAYREFLFGREEYHEHSHAHLVRKLGNSVHLLSLHSFTKCFGVPGLRLGYMLGQATLLHEMASGRAPWMVSRHAELCGLRLLEHRLRFDSLRVDLRERRQAFLKQLAWTGLFSHILPSSLNFLTCRLRRPEDAAGIYARLAARGILVRVCDSIPGMPPGYLRLQVRATAENVVLVRALRELAGITP